MSLRVCTCAGRDPLAGSSHNKLDMAAVASILKAYFRELSTPLFPTDMYKEFISCTHQETVQARLEALTDTINFLPPQIICVMRFLFSFLYRVSLQAADNKMGSANLALVFGPTLTRAPDSMDPRQLHNDVPSVNILIQMCIDRHKYIFDEEAEQESPAASHSPEEREAVQNDPPLSTSPPNEPPTAPPTTISAILDSTTTSPEHVRIHITSLYCIIMSHPQMKQTCGGKPYDTHIVSAENPI